MEFKEFSNPSGKDYDIISSLKEKNEKEKNEESKLSYFTTLWFDSGMPEYEELGLTEAEFNEGGEVALKALKEYIQTSDKGLHR